MRALIDEKTVEKFNSKKLYKQVLEKFDEYNISKLTIQHIAQKSLTKTMNLREEKFQNTKSDKTLAYTIESEKYVNFVYDFESKIEFLKTQFTIDESIIFNRSIEERELDKIIMDTICKSEHKYYQIKKSCYLKIALCFGIIKPRQENNIGIIAQYE